MCALKSQIMSNAPLKLFLSPKMWGSSAPWGKGLRNPLPPSPPPIGCSMSFSVIPGRVGIKKNFLQVHVLYVTCDNTHERIERHKMLKSLRAFPLFLLIIVINIPFNESYLGSCISASTFPSLTKT